MANIKRYPVPADSFEPNRPLNDLLVAQLEHFQAVEQRLPRPLRPSLNPHAPEPLPHDAPASNQYVAAMTRVIHEHVAGKLSKPGPKLASKPRAYSPPAGIAIAAASASTTAPAKASSKNKKPATGKPKRRTP